MSDLLSQEEMEDLGLEAEQVNFVWFPTYVAYFYLHFYLSTNYNLYVLRDFI